MIYLDNFVSCTSSKPILQKSVLQPFTPMKNCALRTAFAKFTCLSLSFSHFQSLICLNKQLYSCIMKSSPFILLLYGLTFCSTSGIVTSVGSTLIFFPDGIARDKSLQLPTMMLWQSLLLVTSIKSIVSCTRYF